MKPRPYQAEAIALLDDYLSNADGNPCIVIPTGGGKTPCMAWKIEEWLKKWPGTRVLVLSHVKELLQQGVDKMRAIWPWAPIGIYSAGLNAKEMNQPITYASIQSIWRKACDFDPWDIIFVDEAHRIPTRGDKMYRKFLADAKLNNPIVRVVGWTATPYRLAGGPVCGPDRILNEIIYEANVKDLIDDGFLCRLTTKGTDAAVDTAGVSIRSGEFDNAQLTALVEPKVAAAVSETMRLAADRKSILFFCVNVEHAHHVSAELSNHGIEAPVVHASTPSHERAAYTEAFANGRLRALCNVNVLSEGFDAPCVDCVVLLRPTASAGLFYQQVGRGLRLHESKENCLVLDFSGNTERHGPIDCLRGWSTKTGGASKKDDAEPGGKPCPNCREIIPASARECRECGHVFPAPEIKHLTKPSNASILSPSEPWEVQISDVAVDVHRKEGKPDSLRVTYYATSALDSRSYREYICLAHGGYAEEKARRWWVRRFGDPVPKTANEAIASNMFLADELGNMTQSIKVKQVGKYTEITHVTLKDVNNAGAIAR